MEGAKEIKHRINYINQSGKRTHGLSGKHFWFTSFFLQNAYYHLSEQRRKKNTLSPKITVEFYSPSLNVCKTISNCLKVNGHSWKIYFLSSIWSSLLILVLWFHKILESSGHLNSKFQGSLVVSVSYTFQSQNCSTTKQN